MYFFAALCTSQHKPHLQFHHSLLKCCSAGTALCVGLIPFFQRDLIMIDGICANSAPKLLSALKGSVAFSLINLFALCSFPTSEVYISLHMLRRTRLFTWRDDCKDFSRQVSKVGVGIIFSVNEFVNRSFVLRGLQLCRGVYPGAFISTWLFYRPSRSF